MIVYALADPASLTALLDETSVDAPEVPDRSVLQGTV
jgi:hypothetical protein